MDSPFFNSRRPAPRRGRGFRSWINRTSNPILAVLAVLVVLALLAIPFTVSRITEETQTFTVTRVLDQTYSTGSGNKHRYLIYTDHGTYKDTDTIWFFKFNSSDLLGQLQNGRTYTCRTTGFRFGFTSSYRNLISCHEGS